MRVAGASQYLNQATLANTKGLSAKAPNLLGIAAAGASLLEIGRNLGSSGIGVSANARALNNQFLESSASTANQLFSLSGGGSATIEAAQVQIAGLASTVPASRDVIIQDDGTVTSNSLGAEVDETA